MKKLISTAVVTTALLANNSIAQDVVSISTTVKGNQEHPSVTYIVPWRQASDETVLEMPFNTRTRLVDVFDHVDREEHVREVDYLTKMRSTGTTEAQDLP